MATTGAPPAAERMTTSDGARCDQATWVSLARAMAACNSLSVVGSRAFRRSSRALRPTPAPNSARAAALANSRRDPAPIRQQAVSNPSSAPSMAGSIILLGCRSSIRPTARRTCGKAARATALSSSLKGSPLRPRLTVITTAGEPSSAFSR